MAGEAGTPTPDTRPKFKVTVIGPRDQLVGVIVHAKNEEEAQSHVRPYWTAIGWKIHRVDPIIH